MKNRFKKIFKLLVIMVYIPICILLIIMSWIRHPIIMAIVTILSLLEERFIIGLESMGPIIIIPIYIGLAFCFTLL